MFCLFYHTKKVPLYFMLDRKQTREQQGRQIRGYFSSPVLRQWWANGTSDAVCDSETYTKEKSSVSLWVRSQSFVVRTLIRLKPLDHTYRGKDWQNPCDWQMCLSLTSWCMTRGALFLNSSAVLDGGWELFLLTCEYLPALSYSSHILCAKMAYLVICSDNQHVARLVHSLPYQ